jgi:hypothetical protein
MNTAYILTAAQAALAGFVDGLYNRPLSKFDPFTNGVLPGEHRARHANLSQMAGIGVGVDTFSWGSTQLHPLGTMAFSRDGRIFRYCQAGASDLVVGNIVQSAAPVANHLANTPPAVAIGDKSFLYTPGATAGAANLYAEGTLMVDTTPGNGYTYGISGHPAIVSATAFLLTLDDPIQVALTASSRVGLHTHPYKNVIQCPTTVTAPAVGGVVAPITATQYGWLQTRGPFAALINGTPAVGVGVVTSATTAGAVDVAAVAAEINVRIIGRTMQVGVSTKNNGILLAID